MSNLMKPFIKLDDAQCFDCMVPIRVYDMETIDVELSSEGNPISINPLVVKLFGVCPKCGRTYKIARHGIGFGITSDLRDYILGGEDDDETSEHSKNYNEFGYVPDSSR